MNSFKNQIAALVGFSLLLGLPAKSLAHERGHGTFTTIDFPGAAGTMVPPLVRRQYEHSKAGRWVLLPGSRWHGARLPAEPGYLHYN